MYRSIFFRGEILGIMGESGSGKSTVVKCLFFEDQPDEGEAFFYDQDKQYDLFNLNKVQSKAVIESALWHGLPKSISWVLTLIYRRVEISRKDC